MYIKKNRKAKHDKQFKKGEPSAFKGHHHTEYSKKLLREARAKQGGTFKGKHHTEETKKKISLAKTGVKLNYVMSNETRNILSDGKMGIKNPMYGKRYNHTEETKRKIREKRKELVIPTKDTRPEKMMQVALMIRGIRFEKHKAITGQPDIFIRPNICIFIDGDYYHANPDKYKPDSIIHKKHKNKPVQYAKDIWAKDLKINSRLWKEGYQIIRLWEHDILENRNDCANKVMRLIERLMAR